MNDLLKLLRVGYPDDEQKGIVCEMLTSLLKRLNVMEDNELKETEKMIPKY